LVSLLLLAAGCTVAAGDAESAASPLTVDLFEAPMPEPLQAALELDRGDVPFVLDTQRALYKFGVAQPTDARPWLLLAHDAMRTQTYSFAVRFYRMATRADERAARHPGAIEDLLNVVRVCAGQTELTEARELIADQYGEAVLDTVAQAAGHAEADHDAAGAARLAELIDFLQIDEPVRRERARAIMLGKTELIESSQAAD
jgi:hypothetical protein